MHKNKPSSQGHIKYSSGETTSCITNQTSVNLRKSITLASSPTTALWDWISITRKKNGRNTNTWRWNNMFLNNQQVTEEIKKEIKKFLETNGNENMTIYGMKQKQY